MTGLPKYLNILAKDDDVTTRDHAQWMVTLQQHPELTASVVDESIGSTAHIRSSSSSDATVAAATSVPGETDVEAEMLAAAIAASLAGNG